MSAIRIAVLDDYQSVAEACADWDSLGCDVTFFHDHLGGTDAVVDAIDGFDVVVAMRERTPFDAALLDRLPSLQLLITTGRRNASFDLEAAARNNLTVCGTPSPGHATAELSFALIQLLARGLISEVEHVRNGGWQLGVGRDLRGAQLGVIGLGRLGSQVARFGLAFGMEVVAWSENLTDARAREVGVAKVSLDDLLAGSDFVSIHLRLSDRSTDLLGAGELAKMKPGSYLINTSRSPIVDEAALVDAVRRGHLGGAGIDVFSQEPLPLDHPYRTEPNIVMTPHIGYVTKETYDIFYPGAVEAVAAWQAGEPIMVVT